MNIIVLLIGISLVMALVFLGVFFWAIKSGQFDDTYTPSVRMLFEEKKESKEINQISKSSQKVSQSQKGPSNNVSSTK